MNLCALICFSNRQRSMGMLTVQSRVTLRVLPLLFTNVFSFQGMIVNCKIFLRFECIIVFNITAVDSHLQQQLFVVLLFLYMSHVFILRVPDIYSKLATGTYQFNSNSLTQLIRYVSTKSTD